MRLVYFTWDGPGAAYLRSLYLPIFARLPLPVEVVQISYGETDEIDATAAFARRLGVGYRARHFVRGSSTPQTLARGSALLFGEAIRLSAGRDLCMSRSVLPTAALLATALPSARFLYDADGLAADERIDFGGWSSTGLPYRGARFVERRALRRAAVTLTRTHAARAILMGRAGGVTGPIVVAPNGTDEKRFTPMPAAERAAARARAGLGEKDLLVCYCGGLGPQYRPDLMAVFVRALRAERPDRRVRFLVLTGNPTAGRVHFEGMGDVEVKRVAPEEVAREIGPADVALALREPSFSQRAVAPIKLGEYLLCGLPIVVTRGVGDLDELLDDGHAVFLDEVSVAGAERAARTFAGRTFDPAAARRAGERHFGLEGAVAGYGAAVRIALERRNG